MKNYSISVNTAPKFQDAQYAEIATVQAKSKKAALSAFRFYLKNGIDPTDAIVSLIEKNARAFYGWNCAFKASLK